MEIRVKDRTLEAALADDKLRKKRFGEAMAKKIELRLTALRSAASLAVFWPPMSGPERCHQLKGDLKGTFSIDVKQPYRLLFQGIEDPGIEHTDERERWLAIKAVEIVGIEDTHG
jgi:plasmid maintenance system killer protein